MWRLGPLDDQRLTAMPNEPVFLMRAEDAAKLCGVSTVTWRRWDSAGRIPQGLKIGGARLWRRGELLDWIQAGSPPREQWQAILQASTRKAVR